MIFKDNQDYDVETHLYYLNSRYYDSETGRFISPDTLSILDETHSQINGLNLYLYCNDNPVMFVDPSGCFPFLILLDILLFTPDGETTFQVMVSIRFHSKDDVKTGIWYLLVSSLLRPVGYYFLFGEY